MAEEVELEQMEEPQDILYQPGISFTNPRVVRIAAPVRANPWFWERKGVGPLSASSKLRRWDGNVPLAKYKPVWRRSAKERNTARLGAYFQEVPTISELGQAPPPTAETPTTTRGPLGFLENLISAGTKTFVGVTDILQRRELQKQEAARAQAQAFRVPFVGDVGGTNMWMWVAGIGVVGVGAYLLFGGRRR